jgi:hypothetical protein
VPTAPTPEPDRTRAARASRRDRRIAGAVLAIALPAVLAGGGCGPATAAHPDAEVAAAPDCTAADVLWGLGLVPPEGEVRPAPAAGAVPAGFEPVAAVHCRGPLDGPATLVEPPVVQETIGPPPPAASAVPRPDSAGEVDLTDLQPEAETGHDAPAARPVTVTEAWLEGDLRPLLAALDRPSEVPRPDQACPAVWQSQPQVYLVDEDGRAVRVRWPSDVCGSLLGGVTRPLDALEVARTQVRTVEVL